MKGRAALKNVTEIVKSGNESVNEITVEQYLNQQCELIIQDLQKHTATMIAQLKSDYQQGAQEIRALMSSSSSQAKTLCVTLKCVGGAHLGQKFRLEPSTDNGEDVFKMGRSTGKLFKEKGVSLYKDKEISTTHARVEIRNGEVFLVDADSTNGTQLNNVDVAGGVPMRLKEGDVITMGSTELMVHVTDLDDIENKVQQPSDS